MTAKICIETLPPSADLVVDKGYDNDDLRAWLAARHKGCHPEQRR